MTRRFPPPWTVEQIPGGYKVKDANGQSLAYVYGRETRADADIANVLTMDEARLFLTIARPAGASSFWNIPTLKRLSASAAALAFQLHPGAARDSLKPGFHSWRAGLLVFGTLQPRVSLTPS